MQDPILYLECNIPIPFFWFIDHFISKIILIHTKYNILDLYKIGINGNGDDIFKPLAKARGNR